MSKFSKAKSDIKCWKIVELGSNGEYISLYMKYKYKPNILYKGKAEFAYNMTIGSRVDIAFHSYSKSPKLETYLGELFAVRFEDDDGFPIATFTLEEIESLNSLVAVECIIPKGSNYCENNDFEIVSDKIILSKYYVLV